jgi:hypothetical protein
VLDRAPLIASTNEYLPHSREILGSKVAVKHPWTSSLKGKVFKKNSVGVEDGDAAVSNLRRSLSFELKCSEVDYCLRSFLVTCDTFYLASFLKSVVLNVFDEFVDGGSLVLATHLDSILTIINDPQLVALVISMGMP